MNGSYAEMFEEEYQDVISNLQIGIGEDDYMKYLSAISADKTHAGYFSIDKKGKMIDSKVARKETTTDDVDAYDLIMKNKELAPYSIDDASNNTPMNGLIQRELLGSSYYSLPLVMNGKGRCKKNKYIQWRKDYIGNKLKIKDN